MKTILKRWNKRISNLSFWGTLTGLLLLLSSCREYLNVVPDNTLTLDNVFSVKEEAYNALAKVYSYMPFDNHINYTDWWLGDEWVTPTSYDNTS
ncbi:MAG: hypothetical protein LBT50_00625, partial [Prevotellaceae bacterium]|nr:hypothetical protein [Prevotellaceae bacterium]